MGKYLSHTQLRLLGRYDYGIHFDQILLVSVWVCTIENYVLGTDCTLQFIHWMWTRCFQHRIYVDSTLAVQEFR